MGPRMRRGGGESGQGASVGAPRAGHKRPIVAAGGGHRSGCPGGRQPLGGEGSGSWGAPAAPSPAAGKAWPLQPCWPCSAQPDPCPRASACSPPWRRTSPRALARPAPAASRAPRRGGTAPLGPPPSGAASGSPCGTGGPPGSGCGARPPSPPSPRGPGTLRGLAGLRPPQRRRCRAPGTHAPVGLRCGSGRGHPGARCGAGWGARGRPLFPSGAEEQRRCWGRVASGGEMWLADQQGPRAGNVPGAAKLWCPSMAWPWHLVGTVGEGKGHVPLKQPDQAGGQPGDPHGSPDTTGSTPPRCPHTRVHTHARTPVHTQGMAVPLHPGPAASNRGAKGGEVSHASASGAEGQIGLNKPFPNPLSPGDLAIPRPQQTPVGLSGFSATRG